ncbi:MAG: alpha-hydroxy-acid oxidizing protein [Alphaproteobacteria bacterium]|jgi:isopentenyl diphosphate isomerase/L-lactate dehydrogenase-like FMN-dependent dehydrogenase|nr:alpha-hydroxy-acid oxidizing protein [Alphaproteobacteria bacterium]MBT7943638.1 alpha-hydroxy-acid oxidizing protein [Alphaproteobacteria bacterium]
MTNNASDLATLHQVVHAARENLNDNAWDYVVGGADTETTIKRNRHALDSLAFRPRVLNDVTDLDVSGALFGQALRIPVVLAPIGSLQDLHPDGGVGTAGAAAEFGTISFLSSVCKPGLEAVAEAAPGENRIFQLYVRGDDDWVDDFARRAIAGNYTAFCMTVDLDHYGRRERDIAKGHLSTSRRTMADNEDYQKSLSWDHVKRFKDTFDIPLILKGIATAEDAGRAIELGVDGIYVSNHGGRQLDHGRGGADVLPEVVDVVGGKAQIIVDGGFMRGTDVVKAMALGADAVAIGRLQAFGMGAAGQAGVVRVLELLETEIRICLGLLGVTGYEGLDNSYLHRDVSLTPAHVLSALPLLEEEY